MISVIIPVYNDPEGLKDTLDSLVDQELDREYELLPVDNNSTDQTAEVIKDFEQRYPDLVNGLEENNVQSSYAARNKGIENAEGDIICFLDADMWVDTDYLSKISSYFEENPEVDYVGCQVEIVKQSDSLASKFDEVTGFQVKSYLDELGFVPTCCLSVRKEVFDEIGKFNQKLVSGGDKEFGRRVNSSNLGTEYLDSVRVYHPARTSVRDIASKYFRIGRGDRQLQANYNQILGENDERDGFSGRGYLPEFSIIQKKVENLRNKGVVLVPGFLFCYVVKQLSYYSGYLYEMILVSSGRS